MLVGVCPISALTHRSAPAEHTVTSLGMCPISALICRSEGTVTSARVWCVSHLHYHQCCERRKCWWPHARSHTSDRSVHTHLHYKQNIAEFSLSLVITFLENYNVLNPCMSMHRQKWISIYTSVPAVALKTLKVIQRTHRWLDGDSMTGTMSSSLGRSIHVDLIMMAQTLK